MKRPRPLAVQVNTTQQSSFYPLDKAPLGLSHEPAMSISGIQIPRETIKAFRRLSLGRDQSRGNRPAMFAIDM
jgi:hypothetical protein